MHYNTDHTHHARISHSQCYHFLVHILGYELALECMYLCLVYYSLVQGWTLCVHYHMALKEMEMSKYKVKQLIKDRAVWTVYKLSLHIAIIHSKKFSIVDDMTGLNVWECNL